MLILERARREALGLPTLVKLGIVALLLSGFADLIGHVDAGFAIEPIGQQHGFTPAEATAHLAVFVSMVLILAGVVLDGVRRSRERRASTTPATEGVA